MSTSYCYEYIAIYDDFDGSGEVTKNKEIVRLCNSDYDSIVPAAIERCKDYEKRGCYKRVRWTYVNVKKVDGKIVGEDYVTNTYSLMKNFDIKWTWFDSFTRIFHRIAYKLDRAYYNVKYAFQRAFRGYDDIQQSNIDTSLIELIIKMVKSHKENKCSLANYAVAMAKDIKEGKAEPIEGIDASGTEESIAAQIYDRDLDLLVLNAQLYLYYSSHCIEDEMTKGFETKYPRPLMPYSDYVVDYEEEYKRFAAAKDYVFNWLKEHIYELWD